MDLMALAGSTRGFMPPDEGMALHRHASEVAVDGPFLEVGSYCGKSAVYLGSAAESRGRVLYSVDHHQGSEENQPGWEWHEPDLVDSATGRIDTLPTFRRTIQEAALEATVVAVVGDSPVLLRCCSSMVDMGPSRRMPTTKAGCRTCAVVEPS